MKQKLFPVLCAILAAALLLSVTALIFARSEAKASEQYIQFLTEQVQTLEEQNRALQLQLSYQDAVWVPLQTEPAQGDDSYCTLVIDSWQMDGNVLTVSTFAQAALAEGIPFRAQLELWHGDAVLASEPVSLTSGEASGIFEADVAASFTVPELGPGEELQLWLMVEPEGGEALFGCGASWYAEDGRLLLITG